MARFRLIVDFDDRLQDQRADDDKLYTELIASCAVIELNKADGITVESAQLIDEWEYENA